MRTLPLYPHLPETAVEREPALPLDGACRRCNLSGLDQVQDDQARGAQVQPRRGPRTVCVPDEGEPGGLLVVGEGPGEEEDRRGRPFSGKSGQYLRPLLQRWYRGPIALSNATRCRPILDEPAEKHAAACRGYLAQTLEEVRPERIVAVGAWAAVALTGRSVSPLWSRGAYTYLCSGRFGGTIPVYFVVHPAAALRNRFVRSWFEEDLERALTRSPPRPPPLDAVGLLVETGEDAERALADIRRWPWSAFDVESCGLLFDRSFRLLSLSVAPARSSGDETVWLWDERALADPGTREPLARYLADVGLEKRGANVHFDANAVQTSGFEVGGIGGDVRLWRKLLEPEADADLATMAELVGMGGMKVEQAEAEAPEVARIRFGVLTERRVARAMTDAAYTDLELEEVLGLLRTQQVPLTSKQKLGRLSAKAVDGLRALRDLGERLPHVAALARNPDVEAPAWAKAVVPTDVLLRYNARDALSAKRLGEELPPALAAVPPVDRIRRLVVDRAAVAVQRCEAWGVPVDLDALRALEAFCLLKVGAVRDQLDRAVGPDFNPGSPPQLEDLLFRKLRLRPSKQTKGGKNSTDEEVLESLRGKHPVVDLVLEHRKYGKILGTYAVGMRPHVRPDGRLHPSVLLDAARSGRASIKNPALQTVPSEKRDPEMGKMCRDVIAPGPGKVLLQFDYKQVEFRVAAMLSRDPVMIVDIVAGVDAHMSTARAVSRVAWGIPPEAVTDQHRSMAKCFHPDTEVLTRRGWRRIIDLSPGEEVAEAYPSEGGRVRLQWCVPLEVFSRKHPSRLLVHLRTNNGIDLRVTPDHRMLSFRKSGIYDVVTPEEFAGRTSGSWSNAGILTAAKQDCPSSRILRLAVATQADGALDPSGAIRFGFTRARKIARMRRLLRGVPHKEGLHRNGKNPRVTAFRIAAPEAGPILALLDGKKLSWSLLNVAPSLRAVILDEARHWDGSESPHPGSDTYTYSSAIEQNVDVLQAIAAVTGRKTHKQGVPGAWRLTVRDSDRSKHGAVHAVWQEHSGEVACLSVPSSFVLVRDGGIPVITGQTTTFGTLYGKTAAGLAAEFGCTQAQAQAIYDAVMGRFKGLAQWLLKNRREAQKTGYSWTRWAGQPARRRPMLGLADADEKRRKHAENATDNNPIQGTANEYQLASLAASVEWIEDCGLEGDVKLLFPIHDALLFEVSEPLVPQVVQVVRGIMTSHDSEGVPLGVDVEVGPAWGSLQKYKAPEGR